jgi:AraC-like DNA-binding protein
MKPQELIAALMFSIPLIGALVCGAITALDAMRPTHPVRRKIYAQALTSYGLFALCWSLIVARIVFPVFHVWTIPLLMAGMMAACVMMYRMVRVATDRGDGPFAREHFIVPALVLVVLGTLWLALPIERLETVIDSGPAHTPAGYFLRYFLICLCLAYGIVYPVMALSRITRFKKTARNGQLVAGPHDRMLARLWWAILVEMIVMPVPVLGMLLGMEPWISWGWAWLLVVLPSRVIYVVWCFDLLSDNYVVVEPERVDNNPQQPASPQRLARERVDRYIEQNKPWLNPAFRINDMASDLISNRAYVSAFINSEYGVNFNRFVNSFRLEEVERLKSEAKQKKQHIPMLQLILNAGFSSYRSYLRAKQQTPPSKTAT